MVSWSVWDGQKAGSAAAREDPLMDVVCVIGQRQYHAVNSECHRRLEKEGGGPLLTLTAAQAHEVGMEPCGFCMAPHEGTERKDR